MKTPAAKEWIDYFKENCQDEDTRCKHIKEAPKKVERTVESFVRQSGDQ